MIKHLIADKHKEAESTLFFKTMMDRKLPSQVWYNFLFNKMLVLSCMEEKIDPIEGLSRVNKLRDDLLGSGLQNFQIKKTTPDYVAYLRNLDNALIFAHVYVWYMGDLSGGKMIKKIINAHHTSLDFDNPEQIKALIMDKVDTSMIDEIHASFDWVIKLLEEFDADMVQEPN